MRIEVENNRTPVDEFVASLGKIREPVELTRNGEVVATLANSPRISKAATKARSKKPSSEREMDDEFFRSVKEVQAKYDAGTLNVKSSVVSKPSEPAGSFRKLEQEAWELVKQARAHAARKKLTSRQIESRVAKAVRNERKKFVVRGR